MAIFTHVTVGTNNLEKARSFYDAVLSPLGYKRVRDLGDRGSAWGVDKEEFLVLTPADGKPANAANGGAEYTTSPPVTVSTDSILRICSSGTVM